MDIVAVTGWDEEEVSILDGEKLKHVICGFVVSDDVVVVVVLSQVVVVLSVVVLSVVVLSVVVLSVLFEPPSLLLLQEMMVRLKRDMRIICKILFIFFLTTKSKILRFGFRRTQFIPQFGRFYKNVEFYLEGV